MKITYFSLSFSLPSPIKSIGYFDPEKNNPIRNMNELEGEKQRRVGREERQRRGRSQMYHGWRVPLPRREERGRKRKEEKRKGGEKGGKEEGGKEKMEGSSSDG